MVRANLSQLPPSLGAVAAICPKICKPARKSLRLNAASASVRSVAAGFATAPASALIWASSLIAESARSSRLNALSAACAGVKPSASETQMAAARTKRIMLGTPSIADECYEFRNGDGLMAGLQKLLKECAG